MAVSPRRPACLDRRSVEHLRRCHLAQVASSLPLRLAVACAAAAGAVYTYAMRRVDPDLYGYLMYGRLFVERGALTSQDPFAYTAAGFHWVTFEYLSHI